MYYVGFQSREGYIEGEQKIRGGGGGTEKRENESGFHYFSKKICKLLTPNKSTGNGFHLFLVQRLIKIRAPFHTELQLIVRLIPIVTQ